MTIFYCERYDPDTEKIVKIGKKDMPQPSDGSITIQPGDTVGFMVESGSESERVAIGVQNYRMREGHEPGVLIYEMIYKGNKVQRKQLASLDENTPKQKIDNIGEFTWVGE